jgi:thiamine pyrophosphate-dependent acetolactate synthase large subunit-like protein
MLLDRNYAVPKLVGNPKDFLIIAGLAGTAYEFASMTNDGDNLFALGGAMGAALSMGLGLALAQPQRRVLVATGDGELLMNVSALATVGIMKPSNLSILCVDNGHYGETGYQRSHTSLGVDLERMAIGAGITSTMTVEREDQLADGARMLRESNGTSFVVVRVSTVDPSKNMLSLDADGNRTRFRRALLAQA